jgi:hypothetical protein
VIKSFASPGEDFSYGDTVGDHVLDFSPQTAPIGVLKEQATPTGTGLLAGRSKYHQYRERTPTNKMNANRFENKGECISAHRIN